MSPARKQDTASASAAASSETVSKVADLTREAIEAQTRLSGEFADLVGDAVKDSEAAFDAGRAYVESVWREATNYWQAVTDLNFRYAAELMKIATRAGDQVLAAVDSAIKQSPADRGAAAGEPTKGSAAS
jgi:hypothetical protein